MENKDIVMLWASGIMIFLLILLSSSVFAQENGKIYQLSYSPSEPNVLEDTTISIGVENPSDRARSYSMVLQISKEGKIVHEEEFTFTLEKSKSIVFTPQYTPQDLGEHQIIVSLYDKFKIDLIDTSVVTFNAVSQLGPFDIIVDPLTTRVRPGFLLPTKVILENLGKKGVDIELRLSVNCPDIVSTQTLTVFVPSNNPVEKLVSMQACDQEGLYEVVGSIVLFNRSWITASSQFFVNSSYIRLQFDAPDKLILRPGENYVVPIEVTNLGNQKIYDLEFVIQKIPLNWQQIIPKSVKEIKENETVVFIVNITIPKDAELRPYEARFTAVSNEVLERKISTIEVVPLTTTLISNGGVPVVTYVLISISGFAITVIGGFIFRKSLRKKEIPTERLEVLKRIKERIRK